MPPRSATAHQTPEGCTAALLAVAAGSMPHIGGPTLLARLPRATSRRGVRATRRPERRSGRGHEAQPCAREPHSIRAAVCQAEGSPACSLRPVRLSSPGPCGDSGRRTVVKFGSNLSSKVIGCLGHPTLFKRYKPRSGPLSRPGLRQLGQQKHTNRSSWRRTTGGWYPATALAQFTPCALSVTVAGRRAAKGSADFSDRVCGVFRDPHQRRPTSPPLAPS